MCLTRMGINTGLDSSNNTCFKDSLLKYVQACCEGRIIFKPGFHLQQTPLPRHKNRSDYVVEQSSFPLIALFWLKIGRCRGRNWRDGNKALRLIFNFIGGLASNFDIDPFRCLHA